MQSVTAFREALATSGIERLAKTWPEAMAMHAMMCRVRADAPPGAFRDFVAKTSQMTRKDPRVAVFNDMDSFCPTEVRRAACEALFDLIMEGV